MWRFSIYVVVNGCFMSQLIGVDSRWGEARASKFALKYFVAGSLFLSAGVLLLAFQTESFTLSGIISKLSNVPQSITLIAGCASSRPL
jgi:NAD(P)H-quinone oxidoreductase subunit 5